ncbi:hypothetical protein [Hyalangium versicolor]|uniref:hypothetical protein n=1 Tax=Hyalangium versicolor TaxID=2861190 RepID=UPI001CCC0DE2|nr:hypothetical protein [Hyalangium versicolor]
MKLSIPRRSLRLAAMALALPLFAGCGDDTEDPDPTPEDKPLYALTTQVGLSTDTPQSYLVVMDSVDQPQQLSLANAIELPGRALGVGVPKSGAIYVAGSESPTVTRYTLNSAGQLEKGSTVSFEGKGVASIGEYQGQFQFISETKAYYFDTRTAQLIIWNPKDMTVTGSTSMSDLVIQGAGLSFSGMPIRQDNLLIMPAGWRPPPPTVGITKVAGVVVINTTNDSATVVKDERCGYVRDGVAGPDGMIYLATEAYGAAVRRVKGNDSPEPCLLRFNPKTLTYDQTFYKALSSFANGGTVGSIVAGPSGTAYVRVYDESKFTITADTHPRTVASAPAWKWSQLNLSTFAATPVDTLPASTGSTFLFQADDRTLFTDFASDSSSANLRELTDKSGKVTASTQGLTFSFLQLR